MHVWSIVSYGRTLCCFEHLDCAMQVAASIRNLFKYDCEVIETKSAEYGSVWSAANVEGFIALLEFLA